MNDSNDDALRVAAIQASEVLRRLAGDADGLATASPMVFKTLKQMATAAADDLERALGEERAAFTRSR